MSEVIGDAPSLRTPVEAVIDPRDPDPSREGIFVYHNCWKCQSGATPCVRGLPTNCEYPHARND